MKKIFTSDDHIRAYQNCIETYHTVVDSASQKQLNQKPGPDRWSVAEISEHLVASADVYLPPMVEKAKEAGDRNNGDQAFDHGIRMRITCWMLEPPYRIKMGTFEDLKPGSSSFAKQSIIDRFLDRQQQFISFVETFGNRPLDQLTIRSPELSFVSMNLSEALAFLAAHQRRHLWQMEQTLNANTG